MNFIALKAKVLDDKRQHQQSEQTEGRRCVQCIGLMENSYLAYKNYSYKSVRQGQKSEWKHEQRL